MLEAEVFYASHNLVMPKNKNLFFFFFLVWSKQGWKTIELVGEMEQPWCIQIYRMFAGQLEITENTTGQGADISL